MSLFLDITIAVYTLIGLGVWRTATGHFAWEIHNAARKHRKDHPEPEDWVVAGIAGLFFGAVWPFGLLAAIPWPFRSQNEIEGNKAADQARMTRLIRENERRAKQLGMRE